VTELRVSGLTRLESLDLRRRFPDLEITFDETPGGDAKHGELVTIAVLALGVTGVKALAAWIMKDRSSATVEKTIEIVEDDGSTRTETLRLDLAQSTTEAEVVKQLAGLLHVDLGPLADQSA
jgi:hypothetical protein